jgi:hypothetical protein
MVEELIRITIGFGVPATPGSNGTVPLTGCVTERAIANLAFNVG